MNKISIIAEDMLNVLEDQAQDISLEKLKEVNVHQKLLSSNKSLPRSLDLYCPLRTLTSQTFLVLYSKIQSET